MDQIKIGAFLRELRKQRELTQEQLAQRLNVSARTVSRWETGSNMPDIAMLVEIADFYSVTIPQIINAERISDNMNQETRQTAVAMAQYSKNETRKNGCTVAGILLAAFGAFIIVTALAMFPSESSWGGIYAVFGGVPLLVGIYLLLHRLVARRIYRVLIVLGCAIQLFASFMLMDYVAVTQLNQVPRFRLSTSYNSQAPNQLVHKTIFFTAVQDNIDTRDERVYILQQGEQP